jgi:hypothetical protein
MKLNVTAFDHGHLQVVAERSFQNYLHRVRLNTLDMATLADQGQTTTSLVTTENFSPRQADRLGVARPFLMLKALFLTLP